VTEAEAMAARRAAIAVRKAAELAVRQARQALADAMAALEAAGKVESKSERDLTDVMNGRAPRGVAMEGRQA
jgi:hypothetical protein